MGGHQVAAVADRGDQIGPGVRGLQFLAQSRDQHVDGAIKRIGRASVDPVKDLVAGQDASRPLHKAGQKLEFRAGQADGDTVLPRQAAGIDIDDERIEVIAAIVGA